MPAALVGALLAAGCTDLGAPDWSPDGRRIVYTRVSGMRPEVRMLNVDAGGKPQLIAGGAFRARWSPDGGRVFYLVASEDGTKGLCSALSDGTDVRTHVPVGKASVSWYAPAPDGDAVYYLSETDSIVYRLGLANARAERVLPADVTCAAAALGPSGSYLACLVPKAGGAEGAPPKGYDVRVFDLEDGSWRRQTASLDVSGKAEAGIVPSILFTPDEREVVAFADPTREIISMPLQRGRTRKAKVPRGGASLVLKSISPDGRLLHLTFAVDQTRFTSQTVDLVTGRAEVDVLDAPVLVGGSSWAPGGGAVAEHTPMGIRISLPDGRWKKRYPVGLDEHVRLAEGLIAEGDPAMALTIATTAVGEAGPDFDIQRLRLLESDAHAALENVRDAARSLYEAWLLHPVSDTPTPEVARRAAGLRHADRLVEVIRRALGGDAASRARTLKAALPLVAEPPLIAGMNFRIAEAALESGDAKEAGKRFRLASETADFPAADYAAGLAGAAHYVASKSAQTDRYAAELLMKAVDLFPASPLQDDFAAILEQARDPAMAVLRRTQDANHASGLAAWGSVRTVRSVSWSLAPTLGDGRRILVEVSYSSTVYIARAEERARAVLRGVRTDIGSLEFAPSGRLLAFVAGQAAYVIDLAGRVVVGDAGALARGGPEDGEIVTSMAWDADGKTLVVEVALPDGTTERRRIDVPKPEAPRPGAPRPGARQPGVPRPGIPPQPE